MDTASGYKKWIHEMNVTSGIQEVDTGGGNSKWIQEVDT